MSNSIFDLLPKEGQEGFFELAESIPSEKSKLKKTKSIISAFPKGFLQESGEQIRKTLSYLPQKLGLSEEDKSYAPISDEEAKEILDKYLPTEEGFVESSLERGGKIAPYAFLGGGNIPAQTIRSVFAGASGEAAKELGAPDWAQALAEIPALGLPGLGKKIRPTAAQKELVEGARGLGLAEEEIAPLIQSEKKSSLLAKAAPRRGRTQKALDRSYQALGKVFGQLSERPDALKSLSPEATRQVITDINNIAEKLPHGLRNLIVDDFKDLIQSPNNAQSLLNFWRDINYYIGKGHKQLGLFKDPLMRAFEDVSPEFANDVRITNQLYGNYAKINQKLKPTLVTDLFTAAGAIRLLTGISLGNYPLIGEILTEQTARSLAREMLINPRLQNLSRKMVTALNESRFGIANKIGKLFAKELKKDFPEVAEEISEADFRDLEKSDKRQKP